MRGRSRWNIDDFAGNFGAPGLSRCDRQLSERNPRADGSFGESKHSRKRTQKQPRNPAAERVGKYQAQRTATAGAMRVSLQRRPLIAGRTHRRQAAETATTGFPGSRDRQPSQRRSEAGLGAAGGFDIAGQNSQGMGQVGRRTVDRQTAKPTLGGIESRSAGYPQRSNPPPVLQQKCQKRTKA